MNGALERASELLEEAGELLARFHEEQTGEKGIRCISFDANFTFRHPGGHECELGLGALALDEQQGPSLLHGPVI